MLGGVPASREGASSELSSAPMLVAEKARKRSPEKWLPVVPVRARPSGTRRASALHCPESSGASVATTVMHEPAPGGASQSVSSIGLSSLSTRPRCLPASTNSLRLPKFAGMNAPTVYWRDPTSTRRDAVPVPPLKA